MIPSLLRSLVEHGSTIGPSLAVGFLLGAVASYAWFTTPFDPE